MQKEAKMTDATKYFALGVNGSRDYDDIPDYGEEEDDLLSEDEEGPDALGSIVSESSSVSIEEGIEDEGTAETEVETMMPAVRSTRAAAGARPKRAKPAGKKKAGASAASKAGKSKAASRGGKTAAGKSGGRKSTVAASRTRAARAGSKSASKSASKSVSKSAGAGHLHQGWKSSG